MSAIVLRKAGRSFSCARCGHVWLPIGRPSGLAASLIAPDATNPATAACAPPSLKNSRLLIGAISVLHGIDARETRRPTAPEVHNHPAIENRNLEKNEIAESPGAVRPSAATHAAPASLPGAPARAPGTSQSATPPS